MGAGYPYAAAAAAVPFGSSTGLDPITQGLDPVTQGYYGKREAEPEADAQAVLPYAAGYAGYPYAAGHAGYPYTAGYGYAAPYAGYGYSGLSYAGLGHLGYYGKRSADADAQIAYAGYPYAAGYAGYPYAAGYAGYAGYGYPYAAATGCRNYLGAAVPC